MNNYLIQQTSGTASSVVIAGILASQLLAGGVNAEPNGAKDLILVQVPYQTHAHQPSFDQVSNLFSGEFDDGTLQFAEGISQFYAGLVATQEPLGAEFERVLNENLWALYEG